jgi:hypothetical protein
MPTNFPISLDALTNPNPTQTLDSPSHSTQHGTLNDAVEALEAKVGVDGSAVATSHDKILTLKANIASPTFTGTVTAPTITSSPSAATTSTAATGVGYMGLPRTVATTGNYTIVAADAGTQIYSTGTRTITIPANATLAMPIGTTIVLVNNSNGLVTVTVTTDTLNLAGVGTTGSRTLGAWGMATLVKYTTTGWIISGNGLT